MDIGVKEFHSMDLIRKAKQNIYLVLIKIHALTNNFIWKSFHAAR